MNGNGILEDTTLFRANSFTMSLFQVFSKVDGVRFLWDLLGSFLLELNVLSKKSTTSTSLPLTESSTGSFLKERISLFDNSVEMEVARFRTHRMDDCFECAKNFLVDRSIRTN